MMKKRLVLMIVFGFLFSITQVSVAKDKEPHPKGYKNKDVAPIVEIISPADGSAISGNLLRIEVSLSATQKKKHKRNRGNVKTVLLKMDGEIVGIYENHPAKKEGIYIFNIDISGHPDAIVILQAFAYHGDMKRDHQGLSAPLSVIIDNTPPQITNLQPADGSILEDPTPILSAMYSDNLSGIDVNTVSAILDESDVTSRAGVDERGFTYTPSADLADGLHTVTVDVSDKAGNKASQARYSFTIKRLNITICSPSEGSTINRSRIMVLGIIEHAGETEVGVKVNGILAELNGNQFAANNIPLMIGDNIIKAEVTDVNGNKATDSITVFADELLDPVELSSNITSGIVPLEINFSISTDVENNVISYQMDYDGDGTIDEDISDPQGFTRIYENEGIYHTTAYVSDDQDNQYKDTLAINVLSKDQIDGLLRAKWEGMKSALINGDIDGALRYFVGRSRARYQQIFEAISASLPAIFSMPEEFTLISLFEDLAEYELVVEEGGNTYSYPVYFVRDENGLWGIKSF